MRILLVLVITLSGCTLFENKRGDDSSGDDGSGSGSGGPVGDSFFLQRTVTSATRSSCPVFNEETATHGLDVMTSTVFLDSQLAANTVVRNAPAREGVDPPNVTFTFSENWSSAEGTASPAISYQLFISDTLLTGKANSTFTFNSVELGPVSCSYQFSIFQ